MIRILLCSFLFLAAAITPAQADIAAKVQALAPGGLVHVQDASGRVLVSQNADKPFVPASVAKVVTAWLAMEVLGADYRFETRFYLDDERILYVRGGGDPMLVSEEFALLAPRLLAATGKEAFSGMVIDTSYFPERLTVPGIEADDEAYNALNSALAANFNTIHAVRNGRSVRSAEPQTPITPLAIGQFRARGPNGRGRISLAQEAPELGPLYAGELLREFIKGEGGAVEGDIRIGEVPGMLKPVYIHRQSRPIREVVRLMLLGSNNYVTNQVFLEVGGQVLGGPVSLEKSLQVLNEMLARHSLTDSITMVEGSGISRKNKFTAEGLSRLLDAFAPHAELLKRTKRGSRYKTGTLDDVSTLAGYAQTSSHGLVRFVIALPGRTGRLRFSILSAIEQGL